MEPPALNGRGHAEDEAVVGNEEGPDAQGVDHHSRQATQRLMSRALGEP